jgi:hypothetical protein
VKLFLDAHISARRIAAPLRDQGPVIVRRWAEAGRAHAGCAIVVGVDHGEFQTTLGLVARELMARPQQADWSDLTLFLARSG